MNSVEIRRNFWYQMSQFSTVYNAQGPLTTESPEAPSWHSNGLSAMVGTGCVLTGLLLLVNWGELEGDSHQVTSHILAPATTQPVTSQVSALTTTPGQNINQCWLCQFAPQGQILWNYSQITNICYICSYVLICYVQNVSHSVLESLYTLRPWSR